MLPIRIREATVDDTEGMARVRVDTWRCAYQGILPQDYLMSLSYEHTASRWRETLWKAPRPGSFVYVAVQETAEESGSNQIVGIAIAGPEQSGDAEYCGEVYVLYVLPAFQSQGIGRRLVAACVQRLLQNKLESLIIWVIAKNPHRRFYESLGGKLVRQKEKEIGGVNLIEVGYGWQNVDLPPRVGPVFKW